MYFNSCQIKNPCSLFNNNFFPFIVYYIELHCNEYCILYWYKWSSALWQIISLKLKKIPQAKYFAELQVAYAVLEKYFSEFLLFEFSQKPL